MKLETLGPSPQWPTQQEDNKKGLKNSNEMDIKVKRKECEKVSYLGQPGGGVWRSVSKRDTRTSKREEDDDGI